MAKHIKGHALVIGGSGMLKDVSLWLADQGYFTSVFGRDINKLNSIAQKNPLILPLAADYFDLSSFQKKITEQIQSHGSFDIVVTWLHKNPQQIHKLISRINESLNDNNWELYDVRGSSDKIDEINKASEQLENCNHYQVQLGFKVESGISRWLTNEEIAQGVIKSIQNKTNILVGQLDPWVLKP